jgi:hypothetical protein
MSLQQLAQGGAGQRAPQGVIDDPGKAIVAQPRRVVEHRAGRTGHGDPELPRAVPREEKA